MQQGFLPGLVIGWFIGAGIIVFIRRRKGRSWVLPAVAGLFGGFGLIWFVGQATIARAASELDRGLRAGCEAGCSREGQPPEFCTAYCGCVLDELHERYTNQELNDLIVAASRQGSADAQAALNEPAAGCAESVLR